MDIRTHASVANRAVHFQRMLEAWSRGDVNEVRMTADQLNQALNECKETDNGGRDGNRNNATTN